MSTGVAEGEALEQLRELVAGEGGELAATLAGGQATEIMGPLVAAGERCRDDAAAYALLTESILEGFLVHYRGGRVIDAQDENLRLLAGDYLYALGLSRLAELGDLAAVQELADVIALCAKAHAGAEPPPVLSEAIWMVGAVAVAGGPWEEGTAAKEGLRDEAPEAAVLALEAALRRASELGIGQEAQRALIAFRGSNMSPQAST